MEAMPPVGYSPSPDGDSESESTYLVDSETKRHPLKLQSRAQYRIHQPVRALRDLTINALWYSEKPALIRRADKIGMCSVAPTVFVGRGCIPTCSPGRCRDRLCPTCAMFRAGTLRTRLRQLLVKSRSVRFLTLTMAPVSKDLGKCVDALHDAFRRMRKTLDWKDHVRGGAFVIEVTRGLRGSHWHVHAHVLVDGVYFPHDILHRLWSSAVGEASRVEIKALHDREGAVSYLAKYMAKSTALGSWTHEEICEYAEQMHCRRTVGTFGTWHRMKMDHLDANAEKPKRADCELSYVVVEAVLDADERIRESAAPLLSRLSATWRLLMTPYRHGLQWLDAPIEAKDFHALTEVLLEIREILLCKPMSADEIRREAERIRRKRREMERADRPLFEGSSHGQCGSSAKASVSGSGNPPGVGNSIPEVGGGEGRKARPHDARGSARS